MPQQFTLSLFLHTSTFSLPARVKAYASVREITCFLELRPHIPPRPKAKNNSTLIRVLAGLAKSKIRKIIVCVNKWMAVLYDHLTANILPPPPPSWTDWTALPYYSLRCTYLFSRRFSWH